MIISIILMVLAILATFIYFSPYLFAISLFGGSEESVESILSLMFDMIYLIGFVFIVIIGIIKSKK